jgi:ABC-type multidrug transport system ATPase subunit
VLQLKKATFGYDRVLFTAKDFTLKFGERLVLLGDNGTGKTTLFKGIQNKLDVLSGDLKVGSSVKIGALDQEILFESEDKNILTYFREETLCSEGDSRQKLARYLFTGESVFKKVSSLSGGEKVRLKLALLMEEDINMLLLDEPTNHIDIASRETLEEALVQFDGTILFVSHDRFFIEKVATRVAEVADGQLIDFAGDYKYYKEEQEKISQELSQQLQKNSDVKTSSKKGKVLSTDRLKQNDIKKIEKQVATLENEISEIEEEMLTLNKDLAEQTKTFRPGLIPSPRKLMIKRLSTAITPTPSP